MVEQRIDQCAGEMSRSGVHHHVGGFVDHQQVLVFVENGQGNVLGQHLAGNGLRPADLDAVTHPRVVGGLRLGTVHEHGPLGDQLLEAPPRRLRKTLREIAVQSQAGAALCDLDIDGFGHGSITVFCLVTAKISGGSSEGDRQSSSFYEGAVPRLPRPPAGP
jgi:hypothetical protein